MNLTFEKLREHRKRLEAEGFRRLTAYVSADVRTLLRQERRHGESMGQVLERLLIGAAEPKHPRLPTPEERYDRRIRQAMRQIEHSMRPENRGPRTVRVILRNTDGSCYTVTAAGVNYYPDGQPPELEIL
ncbi:conserved hypothetical protein [Paraburkholderia unamae]|uniref:hypothetical protein n=1 Tax=Paraburkholderia unamae TaxID=219649 RepID=UPI001CB618A8|nr:hypothetical protein [Paraburkholderia unamae]CAG9264414.1 conserved hypothetical protein [Paraburkholderia unamae]